MARGILNIPASEGTGGGDFIRNLYLKEDKESARIRFLTEHDQILSERFHDRDDPPFREICPKAAFGQACGRCDNGDRSRMMFLAWAYQYTHDFTKKPTGDCEKIQVGDHEVYRVTVDDVRLMCYPAGHKGSIQAYAQEYGTLLDRPYKWVRSGVPNDKYTTYTLMPSDREEMPKELTELIGLLPDLEGVATGEVESLDFGDDNEPAAEKNEEDSAGAVEEAQAQDEAVEGDKDDAPPF